MTKPIRVGMKVDGTVGNAIPTKLARKFNKFNMREVISAYVGERINAKRVAAQFSLRDLGGMASISAAGLQLIESGRVLPPLDTLYRVAIALGVEPKDLLPNRHLVVRK